LLFTISSIFAIYNFYGSEQLDVARYIFLAIIIVCILILLYHLLYLDVIPAIPAAWNAKFSKHHVLLVLLLLWNIIYLISTGFWLYTMGEFPHGSDMDNVTNTLAQFSMYISIFTTIFNGVSSSMLAYDAKFRIKYYR
jgi:H+/Cl- antiporter ClcA